MSAKVRVFERGEQSFRVIEFARDRQAFANFFPPSQTRLLSFDDLRKSRKKLSSQCARLFNFFICTNANSALIPRFKVYLPYKISTRIMNHRSFLYYFFSSQIFHYIKLFDEQPTSFRHPPMSYDNFYEFNKFSPHANNSETSSTRCARESHICSYGYEKCENFTIGVSYPRSHINTSKQPLSVVVSPRSKNVK